MTGLTGFSPTGRVVTRSGMGASQRLYSIVLNCTQCKPKIVLGVLFILHIVLKLCKPPDVLHALSLQEQPIGADLQCKSCRASQHYFENCSTCKKHYNHSMRISTRDARPAPTQPSLKKNCCPGPPEPQKFSRLPRPTPP